MTLPIENATYIDDLKTCMNLLNDRHPHFMAVTLIVFNLCAIVAIPLMIIGWFVLAIYKIVSLPFRKGASNETDKIKSQS